MNRLLALMVLSTSLLGIDVSILEKNQHSITLEVNIPHPDVSEFDIGNKSLPLPRWSDAQYTYQAELEKIVPFFTIPILLPPDGSLPIIEIIATQSSPDDRIPGSIRRSDFKPDLELPIIPSDQIVNVTPAEDFRSYNTGRLTILPYANASQRLEHLTFRLQYPDIMGAGSGQDSDLIATYINSDMAQKWGKIAPMRLNRVANALPSGQWFRFPINEMGIQEINVNSFPGTIPDSDPRSWQVYAPFYEGESLPFGLSNTEPTPDNLKAISMKTSGLEDGEFSENDQILFFAQPLNGVFKSNGFTHLYGKQRYYWLCIPDHDSETANHITSLSSSELSATHTVNTYEKRIYHESELHNQLHSGKTWIGEKLTGSASNFNLNFSEDYLDLNADIQFNALLVIDYDAGNFSHNLSVELNGIPLNVSQGNGLYKQIVLNGSAGENMLRDGLNTLRLAYTSNSNASIIYLDSLRLIYDRMLAPSADYLYGLVDLPGSVNNLNFNEASADFHVWDISDPTAVREWQISHNQFRVAQSGVREIIGFMDDQVEMVVLDEASNLGEPKLRRTDMQADYLIITPETFIDEAQRVKTLREEQVPVDERLNVEIVNIQDIYNEFSAGTQDPAAIKHFLHYVYFNWNTPRLRYVLFLGDTDYDYRNITGQSKLVIPTYQKDGNTDVTSYPTDDRYTYIADGVTDKLPDIAIGRLPAQNVDQLEIMIDKIINYELSPTPGIWRNTVTLVADDPLRPTQSVERYHVEDTESLVRKMPLSMHVNKIYLTEYPEVQDPNSPYIKKPKARDALIQTLYNGTLLVNYLGHGSPTVWAQEEVFTVSDLSLVKTGLKLPFWVAGTCDWAKYDDVNSSCVPEELMLMENNGAVGILSTTRKTFGVFNKILLTNFFDFLFPEDDAGRSIPVGLAVMLAKNIQDGSDPNDEKYILMSDPALRLASPVRKGHINSVSPSVIQAMGTVSYAGVADTTLAANARAAVTVYDTPTPVTRSFYVSRTNSTATISYILPGKRIFRGLISVNDENFAGSFTLPKDIKYSGTGGILRVQYWDETGVDGSVFIDTLKFMGTDSTALDNTGPDILFISDNAVLLNGDHFSANEALELEISDGQGINLTGVAGHGITLAIDEDWENAYDVTELFEYDLDHSDKGRLSAFLSEIPPGEHLISAKAWDSQNNPSESSIRLEFFAANDFRIYDLFNYPNPMRSDTDITYMLSHPADVQYAIYTLSGRKIISENQGYQNQGFNSFPWDGRDRFGNQLANGVYILVVEADNDDFEKPAQSLQKLVIAR